MISEKQKNQKKLRYIEYYDLTETFDKLYADSQNNKVFTDLYKIIISDENIKLAYRNIKRNKGSTTAGVDKKNILDLEKLPQDKFIASVKKKLAYYKPKPVKRVEIPKPNGKKRPLGIPAIWDRVVQQCILQVLEPICEAKFFERSNGFRPNRSAENAIAQCYRMIQKQNLHFVVDIDIKGFFDNVNHSKLKKQMWKMGIRDKKLLCIISEMLKAPIVMPDGRVEYPTKGTPQGGILSPLLSNIVLNELDWWIASQWECIPTHYPFKTRIRENGAIDRSPIVRALYTTRLKVMYIVRYADDFKLFCRNRNDAEKVFVAVKEWLVERLNLEISEDKSKIINLKKKYSEFLGFKIKAVKKGSSYVVRSHMSDKAIKCASEKLMKQILYMETPKNKKQGGLTIHLYNSKVWGIHNYYQYATHISQDCNRIARKIQLKLNNRMGERISKKGTLGKGYIRDKYGGSKQLRFVDDKPLCPIGYIRTKNPFYKKKSICKYTPDGREEIHKSLKINMEILLKLMKAKKLSESIEFMDNRISLYASQWGKCGVTGQVLEYDEIHCHHIVPRKLGGTDRYSNLIILHKDVHTLIHSTRQETIFVYLNLIKPNSNMLEKINKLRLSANLAQI